MGKFGWNPQTEIDQKKLKAAFDSKISELKAACTQAIYAGFTSKSTGYQFGFNELDQTNFTQQTVMINMVGIDKYTTPVRWKTIPGEIVTLTAAQFVGLLSEAQLHKETEQAKYWTLEIKVKSASTVEEIQAIVW